MVTVGRRLYDLMYRFGAPWEDADRVELRALVRDGRCSPETLRPPDGRPARAIDLGCGSGNVSCELAEAGFQVTGVDFSPVAVRKARARAAERGLGEDRIRFLQADLTRDALPEAPGPYDLLVDYGTLDDLPASGRSAMAGLIADLARPGARFFLFAFSGDPQDLPRFSFGGPSRAFPGLLPGEAERLFEPAFRVEVLEAPTRQRHVATYLLERRVCWARWTQACRRRSASHPARIPAMSSNGATTGATARRWRSVSGRPPDFPEMWTSSSSRRSVSTRRKRTTRRVAQGRCPRAPLRVTSTTSKCSARTDTGSWPSDRPARAPTADATRRHSWN